MNTILLSCLLMFQGRQDDDLEKEIEALEEQIEEMKQELDKKISSIAKGQSRTAFNPSITGFINSAVRHDDQVYKVDGKEIEHKLFIRSFELDTRAPIDPYADAVAILAFHSNAEEESEVELEEGYFILKEVPRLGAPMGLQFKIGRYLLPIGSNNQLHGHDNPWTTRPRVITDFLGEGDTFLGESGHSEGGQGRIFLPSMYSSNTNELFAGVIAAGELGISGDEEEINRAAYYSKLNSFHQLTPSLDINFGISGYTEQGTLASQLLALDLTLRNRSPQKGTYNSIVAGGELFFSTNREFDALGNRDTNTPVGYFAYIQYQPLWNTYLGIRYDYVEDKVNDDNETRTWGAYISYYTSEFLRIRLGVERSNSDDPTLDKLTTYMLEFNIVFGSHPIEPYWVNR